MNYIRHFVSVIAKNENNPDRILYENLNTLMYMEHPYKRKVIGTSDVIETIRREEILDYIDNILNSI